MSAAFSICVGASFGALFRYFLSSTFNSLFPSVPIGTLLANILGGFLIGMFLEVSKNISLTEITKLAITTGFLGGLTTFSAFSAESVLLLLQKEYLYFTLIIFCHVGGSILATISGIYFIKFLTMAYP